MVVMRILTVVIMIKVDGRRNIDKIESVVVILIVVKMENQRTVLIVGEMAVKGFRV